MSSVPAASKKSGLSADMMRLPFSLSPRPMTPRGAMAAYETAGARGRQLRPLHAATVDGIGATGMEGAAGRRVGGIGHLALGHAAAAAALRIGRGHGGQQRLGVGVEWCAVERVGR